MDIHPYVIQSRSELGSKRYVFMENDKIILLTNLFQHLLSAETLSELKIDFILPYLERNFHISAKNKLRTNCLLTFLHYTRSHLEYGSYAYVKNKLVSKITIHYSNKVRLLEDCKSRDIV